MIKRFTIHHEINGSIFDVEPAGILSISAPSERGGLRLFALDNQAAMALLTFLRMPGVAEQIEAGNLAWQQLIHEEFERAADILRGEADPIFDKIHAIRSGKAPARQLHEPAPPASAPDVVPDTAPVEPAPLVISSEVHLAVSPAVLALSTPRAEFQELAQPPLLTYDAAGALWLQTIGSEEPSPADLVTCSAPVAGVAELWTLTTSSGLFMVTRAELDAAVQQ